jgi:hypothetical protein
MTKLKNIVNKIKWIYRDQSDQDFLGYAVDSETREVKIIDSFDKEKQEYKLGDRVRVSDLPTDTNKYAYGDWQSQVFKHSPSKTTLIFSILFPFFLIVYLMIILTVFPRPMIFSPMLSILLVVMYKILSSTATKTTMMLMKHPSGDPYLYEGEWWTKEHDNFPEEAKKTKVLVVGKGDDRSLVETKERYVWLDCRGEFVKIMPKALEQKIEANTITGAAIMGVAALKNSAYTFAKRQGKRSAMEKNLPYVAVIVISLIGLFFSSNRIMTMLGVNG